MAKDLTPYLKRKKELDPFTASVVKVILAIPRGKVVTYGQVAELAGYPNRSRMIGFILGRVLNRKAPWQRVMGAGGKISFPKHNKHFKLQRKLLEQEGVVFTGARVDLERYRWQRRPKTASGRVQPRMFGW